MKVRILGILWTTAALLAGSAAAQDPTPKPAPIGSANLPPPQPDAPAPAGPNGANPVPPISAPGPDSSVPLPQGSLMEASSWATPGWFVAAELGIVYPRITGFLAGQVNGPNQFLDLVALPTAFYDWTGSPRLELGYRLPEECGELILSYRFLMSDGNAILNDLNGTGQGDMHGYLDLQNFDLDYARHEHVLGPFWDLQWRVGARLTSLDYHTDASNFFDEQHASDHFVGAGPHAGLDLWRSVEWNRVSLYGRVEGAALWGRVHQTFAEAVTIPGFAPFGGAGELNHTQVVPVIDVEAGLAWVPWKRWPVRLSAGYQYEIWWNIARAAESNGSLYDQGVFLRCEWNY